MLRGGSTDSTDDWGDTPFTRPISLQNKSSDTIDAAALEGAQRVYRELDRSGTLDSVSTSWFDVEMSQVGHAPAEFYHYIVGPTVATAPDVTWHSAFTIDLETAPGHKSDDWWETAESFNLSPRAPERGTPSKISAAYAELERRTERNAPTPIAVHPRSFRSVGPYVSDRAFERAMECLSAFEGVHAPDDSKPAWELSEATETDAQSAATEEKSDA